MFRNWLRVVALCLSPLAIGLAAQSTGSDELAALLSARALRSSVISRRRRA
jgi:hypothetical protein